MLLPTRILTTLPVFVDGKFSHYDTPRLRWRLHNKRVSHLFYSGVLALGFLAWLFGAITDKKPWPRQPYHWEEAGSPG